MSSQTRLQSFFTPRTVECPVCKVRVRPSLINEHIDNECQGSKLDDPSVHKESNEESRVTTNSSSPLSKPCPGPSTSASSTSKLASTFSDLCDSRGSRSVSPQTRKTPSRRSVKEASHNSYYEERCHLTRRCGRREFTSLGQAKRFLFGCSKKTNCNMDANLDEEDSKNLQAQYTSHEIRENLNDQNEDEDQESLKNASVLSGADHQALTLDRRDDPFHIPYYVINFEQVVRSIVVHCPDDASLLTQEEVSLANLFLDKDRMLSLDAKRLYVRLFMRKQGYIKVENIKYREITDLDKSITELKEKALINLGSDLDDLGTILRQLSLPSLKMIVKEFKIKSIGSNTGHTKSDLVQALIKHSSPKSSVATFFTVIGKKKESTSTVNPLTLKMKKRAKSLMGQCLRVADEPRAAFMRILSLYSLTNFWDERESTSANDNRSNSDRYGSQLTTILLVNQGKLKFPLYNIRRDRKIFRHRDDLLLFEEACSLERSLSDYFESKKFNEALDVVAEAKSLYAKMVKDDTCGVITHAKGLPNFLRRFTAPAVIIYVLNKGVEVHEKLRDYSEAVKLLEEHLLGQKIFLNHYRGHWYERLSLDLEQHLKEPSRASQVLFDGIKDGHVRGAKRFTLCQRLRRIANKVTLAQKLIDGLMRDQLWMDCIETPSMVILGRMLPKTPALPSKSMFVIDDENEEWENETNDQHSSSKVLCSVEDLVCEHFRRNMGFPFGLHAESSVAHSICTLLFWDVFYDTEVRDAFRAPYQHLPLDTDHEEFYESRREVIERRLDEIRLKWSDEDLETFAHAQWESNVNSVCPVKWDLFNGYEHFLGLLRCFQRYQLEGLCRRLMTDRRRTRSGFPDLTVWNPARREVKFVEVKGPNDRLSDKQVLWIQFLNSIGLESCVCHVETTNTRGKRRSQSSNALEQYPSKRLIKRRRSHANNSKAVHLDDDDDFE